MMIDVFACSVFSSILNWCIFASPYLVLTHDLWGARHGLDLRCIPHRITTSQSTPCYLKEDTVDDPNHLTQPDGQWNREVLLPSFCFMILPGQVANKPGKELIADLTEPWHSWLIWPEAQRNLENRSQKKQTTQTVRFTRWYGFFWQ